MKGATPMKRPTKKELEVIYESIHCAQHVIERITEFPYVDVMDEENYLSKLDYALNEACIKLYQMIKQKEQEDEDAI